jgi:bacillolysin
MTIVVRRISWLAAAAALAVLLTTSSSALAPQSAARLSATDRAALTAWNAQIDQMQRAGDMRVASWEADDQIGGRAHQRLRQFYRGIPVFGGDVAVQTEGGTPVSIFGTVYQGINVNPDPIRSETEVQVAAEVFAGGRMRAGESPTLVVLPRDDGRYLLAWRAEVRTDSDRILCFVDDATNAVVLAFSNLKTQQPSVIIGRGVLGDDKKVAVSLSGSTYTARDRYRPGAITTHDMKTDITRLVNILDNVISVASTDIASTTSTPWTDGAVVDAQVYAGYTYDYFYKRFGRHGLDNRDRPILIFVHPVQRDSWAQLYNQYSLYYTNAFYDGSGRIVFGEGLPPGVTSGGKSWNYTSGAIDIVAHELTHGVTDYSSDLIYLNESGALNEAFSDIMATGVEFFFQPPGSGQMKADYLEGEDAVSGGGLRSLDDPASKGNPDHYSKRYIGTNDNGGVHTNSTIAGHAFYLAIEGGTNRTSGLSVQGVGPANRDQIEKIFYRAFVNLMPSNGTFATARSTTIQAARDLYGAGTAAERAVTDAWTAVGVLASVGGPVAVGTEPTPAAAAARTAPTASSGMAKVERTRPGTATRRR